MHELKLETFPLNGTRLIEASAGTGKTYTIAGLYLRLLLEQQLDVTQILVVTFTEAATLELRGRIRQRIHDALLWLQADEDGGDDLAEMLRAYRGQSDILQHLRDSVTRMDEASVFTIHGFCQRSLSDSAFESGVLFDTEFITDESSIRQQIARDFWRREVVDSSSADAEWILARWQTPAALTADISALVDNPDIRVIPDPVEAGLDRLQHKIDELCQGLRQDWSAVRDETYALLSESPLLGRAAKTFKPERIDMLYAEIDDWMQQADNPLELPPGFELLTTSKISSPDSHKPREIKKGTLPPQHPLFDLADELAQAYQQRDLSREVGFMNDAADYLRRELDTRKNSSRVMFFDDLLSKLDQALSSDGGLELAARIRRQYPVAMIDEFQDTDPKQYRIFRRIYPDDEPGSLFMIGDPKQAIYSFRGADIFTYMQARKDTDPAQGHYTLDTNFRSHSSLIGAINSLFCNAAEPFIYDQDIAFYPVNAAGERGSADRKPLTIDGELPAPLLCWHVPLSKDNSYRNRITKSWAGQHLARGTAAEISHLLMQGREGKALIGDRALRAGDIAVLVRDRFEAGYIRQALAQSGISSVYLSRDSVFLSEEAAELAHLLRAVAQPTHAVRLRTAMATRMLGLSAAEIYALSQDEDAWESRVQSFIGYHAIWNRHGFMPMFHSLMRQQAVISRLLSLEGGERRLTNLLHLVELAQAATLNHPGIDKLLCWLDEQRANPNGNSEDQQLRLESDEDLVQIVTIHKSKGLEYPIVFLPYIWGSKEVRNSRVLTYHDDQRRFVADLGSEQKQQGLQLASQERLAEDLRLLYVALTRAKYRCYFSWGQFAGASDSAMGYLLHQQRDGDDGGDGEVRCNMASLDDDAILRDLRALNASEACCLEIAELPEPSPALPPDPTAQQAFSALSFRGKVRQQWSLTSFSALTQKREAYTEIVVDLPDHDQSTSREIDSEAPKELSRFSFPRGAQAGLLLHHLFEHIDFPSASAELLEPLVRKTLDQYGIEHKWDKVISDWVGSVLDTPLDADNGLNLRQIPNARREVEMEFSFPLNELNADGLNALLAGAVEQSDDPQHRPAKLDFATISGLMKGFIDLVFEYDGRFYLLDYKSNHLGDRYDDYRPAQLRQAMAEHHYDLQYLIYSLALHRYLSRRLPDYDYHSHFGGVYYLFVRGMTVDNGAATGVYFNKPDFALIESLDRLCAGAEERQHG